MSKTFLFVSAQYLPTSGGVERFTYALASKLIRDGHRVIILTSSLRDLPDHETDELGIEIFRVSSIPFMNGRLPLIRPCAEFIRLAGQVWDRPIDYCIINTYFYPLSMYAARCSRRHGIPTIIINHGSAWLMTGNPLLCAAGQLYEYTAARLCKHYCPRFFGVSEAASDWMATFGITAEGVITNAIDPDEVADTADPELSWRRELNLEESTKIIAFVGRMIPEKGVVPMVKAMTAIREVHPDAALLMAGEGPLLEEIRRDLPDGVYPLGAQPYPKVLALLRQADIFCLPTRSEGFACTVLEAAALGCPILTTATGGSPHLLITPAHGTLLRDMSQDSISEACIRALSDENWRSQAAVLAHGRLTENYTWDASLQQLYRAFGL